MDTPLLWDHTDDPCCTLLLAHGAGAAMDSGFMTTIAAEIAQRGVSVCRFEFGYMAARRSGGKKKPPPKADRLLPELLAAIERLADEAGGPIMIGGKSMGGRIAAMAAGEPLTDRVRGVVCLGYPLHPTGKPDQLRLEPLEAGRLPVLICQGDRDPFGNKAEFAALALPERIRLAWLEDGDHDFGPRGRAPVNRADNWRTAADAVAGFVRSLTGGPAD